MSGRALVNGCRRRTSLLPFPPFFSIIKSLSSSTTQIQSPSHSNLLRLLRNEIQYHHHYAPPHQPVTEFDGFMVEDRPGEQWITLRGKSAKDENIKIEATMFDGSIIAPKSCGENLRLHISVLVDIWKGEGTDLMEFVCSAWPDSLEIQKVYIFRILNTELRTGFYEFLKTRGVNDGLSKFLHDYMMNKDRIELMRWLGKVQSYFEK
ncbi:uncharacterized protein At2g39795, mitochondrial isoform X2 [Sesamum indicum]|uniref:Uncharacterized protein At2g39795, mitochondrial isoform X2 n=1 Tax=Sesamum indicum TaxID=4182 RepID=A0A8M8UUG7_SESIN|nr:uncharacterized protein At2g39795, mitochondrial isoform X2 [Sesamum indicum]